MFFILLELMYYSIGLLIFLPFNLVFLGVFLKVFAYFVKYLSKFKFSLTDVSNKTGSKFTVGFFHPFCNSGKLFFQFHLSFFVHHTDHNISLGGGGERVLWSAVKVLQDA